MGKSRTTLWILIAATFVAIAAALVLGGGGGTAAPTTGATPEFATAALRDLAEVSILDGTLGFPEGDDVASRLPGTITSVAASGTIVAEGEVLFEVDGEPVVLLLGPLPAYRDLGQEPVSRSVAAGTGGIVTAVPQVGTVVHNGDALLRIGNVPLVVLVGDLPAWRSLRRGDEGPDVRQLEAALVALGFDPGGTVTIDEIYSATTAAMVADWQEAMDLPVTGRFSPSQAVFLPGDAVVTAVTVSVGTSVTMATPVVTLTVGTEPISGPDVLQLQDALGRLGYGLAASGVFDDATGAAVMTWQADIGAEPDGVIGLGEVVFLAQPVRVTEALITVGRPVGNGSAVLATTGSTSVVLVDLPAENQQLLTVGQTVGVELPDGTLVDGVVTAISGIATRRSSGMVVFETTVELPSVDADLDQAPVDVLVVTDERTRVLAVPVTALLALAEGGYAVEVDAGNGATRLVAVIPGLYADGWVQVDSTGLVAGDRVVVP